MAKNIQVLINTGNPATNQKFEVVQGGGDAGKPTRISAVKGAQYQLEDPAAKNTGPAKIGSKRVGKNLHVMLDGSTEADLIVENYYDDDMLSDNNRGLYGRAEDGKLYEYIPENSDPTGLPINLADGGSPVSQVLGEGTSAAASGLVAVAAFNPLLLGAAAVGAAAAGGGGGGGASTGGNAQTTPAPDTTAPVAPTGVVVSSDGKTVAGKTDPNTTVSVKDVNGNEIATGTSDANGNFTVTLTPALTDGQAISVTAVDAGGQNSTPATAPDTAAPAAPTGVAVNAGGTAVTGTTEPGATVTVKNAAGTVLGTAVADTNGAFSVPVSPAQTDGQALAVTAADGGGTSAPAAATAPDTTATVAPTAPTSYNDDIGNDTGATSTAATTDDAKPGINIGTVPAGTTPTLYVDGNPVAATYNPTTGTLTPTAALGEGAHALTYTLSDAAGNESAQSTALSMTVDTTVPALAASNAVVITTDANNDGSINVAELGANVSAKVSLGATAAVGDVVSITDGTTTNTVSLVAADVAAGYVTSSFSNPANGATITVTAHITDAAGSASGNASDSATVDTTAPSAATLTLSNYTDSSPAAGTLAANQSTDLVSTDKSFNLALSGSEISPASYEVSNDSGVTWTATTAAQNNLVDGKYMYRASVTDTAGNTTAASNTLTVVVDTAGPLVDLQKAGSTLVAGTAEAGALVAIDIGNNGSIEATVTADASGKWTWTSGTPVADATAVSVKAYDLAGNVSAPDSQASDGKAPTITFVPSDGTIFSGTASDEPTPSAAKPITVTLQVDSDSNGTFDYTLTETALVSANGGTWTIDPVTPAAVNVGATVKATATDFNGNTASKTTVIGGGTTALGGADNFDNFGYDVQAIGDFNGDGYQDFSVVAPNASGANAAANAWGVYVLYGSKQGLPDLASIGNLAGTDGLKIYTSAGIADSNLLSAVQGSGDVNGDGYSDLIVYDDNLNSAWVIFGRSSASAGTAPVTVNVNAIISSGGNAEGVAIVQSAGSAWFGVGAGLADVNGDGYADIIVQDSYLTGGYASTAIIYGHSGAAGSATWKNYFVGAGQGDPNGYVSDSNTSTTESSRAHTMLYNDNTNGFALNVMNIGDINGDGYEDIAYALFGSTNPANGAGNSGAIQVLYGKAGGFPIDYTMQTNYVNVTDGFRVYGAEANQFLGTHVDYQPYGYLSNLAMPISAGDVNGDGIADMVVGSPQFGPDSGEQAGPGRVYVVYGKAGGVTANINLASFSASDGFVITASDSSVDAMFGNGTSVGDFNGDGYDDIAIGAPLADIGGKVNNGAVYIVYGKAGGYASSVSLAATYQGSQGANSTDVNYDQNGDANSGSMLGVNVALSDLNGDGQADLALGSPYHDAGALTASGFMNVVYSSSFNFTNLYSVASDTVTATGSIDKLSGGPGDDFINGVGASDVAYGGAGNDTITINNAGFTRVDGGLGVDTLVFGGSDLSLDLATLGLKVQGFENFDLGTGASNTGNLLSLRLSDVLAQQSSVSTLNGNGQGHLQVTGDAGDKVDLLGTGWATSSTQTVGAVTYNVWHNATGANALGDVWIQQSIVVI